MLALNLYIHGVGSIAPAADETETPVTKKLASEPDYTAWIPPMQLRRTSKVVRMGIGAAKMCMAATGMERPDALSLGTAMGCLQDTEVFLSKMVSQEEKMLTPTSFIQSTHNTVGGQIALLMGCHGHNMTFVHRGHSFEHAVINAKLYLQDHTGETILTGGIDELTNSSHLLMQRADFYATERANTGVIAGEGATFFAINENSENALIKISALHLFVAQNTSAAVAEVSAFFNSLSLVSGEIDLLITGRNGAQENDAFYTGIQTIIDPKAEETFKQACGEYATASAFALSQGLARATNIGESIGKKKILIINHYCDHYSCWLLEK